MNYFHHSSLLLHYLLLVLAVTTKAQYINSLHSTGFLPGIGTYLAYNNYVRNTRQIDSNQVISSEKEDSKCTYVQMKGAAIPGADCQEGGMACDKECGFVDTVNESAAGNSAGADTDRGCITVMEEMCGDVSKEECNTVDDKICEPVSEEICDDPMDDLPRNQTR